MPLVFVYGTLKAGGEYHHEMAGAQLLGTHTTPAAFAFHPDPCGYPAAVQGGDLVLQGEVYDVTTAHLAALDVFEGAFYTRTAIITAFGNSWIYLHV